MPGPSWAVRKAKATAHAGPRFNWKLPVRAVPARTWHIGLARAVPSFAGNGTRYSGQCPLVPVLALRPRPKEAVAFRRSVPGLRSVQRSSGWYGVCSPNANRHTNRRRAHSRENFRSRSSAGFVLIVRSTPAVLSSALCFCSAGPSGAYAPKNSGRISPGADSESSFSFIF